MPSTKLAMKPKPKTETNVFVNSVTRTPHFRRAEVNMDSLRTKIDPKKIGTKRFDDEVEIRRKAFFDTVDAMKEELAAFQKKYGFKSAYRKD